MVKEALVAALLLAAAMTPSEAAPYAQLPDHPSCTRDELKAATDAYVKAQAGGTIAAMPLASDAHYLENMETVEAKAGLWNTALPIAHVMNLHDDKRCKTFTEIIVTKGGHPYVIGTRLYLHAGKIIRLDSLVTDKGDWLFNANAYLKYATQEPEWTDLYKYQKSQPSEMVRGANAYLDAFSDKFLDVPWGTPCARIEGGAYTNVSGDPHASCEVGLPPGILYIVNRDYLIDTEKGVINIFCRFSNSTSGMPDSHSFRFIDSKIRGVHTLSVNLTSKPSPQANDDGTIPKDQN